ncbi:hypothetical protein QBC46DRAFT_53720 [Diplogelasinospora grovesii]|uniref:Uncharacterized protein n=1 Tax=Diplogelasinospora grovesii TaxID=303347 RepID=A0AAN6S768_9PEZI|nr:hypothetical protein QBC46DRAFT_53720 [Diplogelasinospora grovesii]
MTSRIITTQPLSVLAHEFRTSGGKTLHAFEHVIAVNSESGRREKNAAGGGGGGGINNALIFIGGLGDGPLGVPYVRTIAESLSSSSSSSWSVFELLLSSSYSGFGFGSLRQDVEEIAAFVAYLRSVDDERKKIVLMGHSTGCQDCMEYAKRSSDPAAAADSGILLIPAVDGFILQGPVSDREALGMMAKGGRLPENEVQEWQQKLETSLRFAKDKIDKGEGGQDIIMPRAMLPRDTFTTPITAYRWWSLAAVGGDDDYFSSDLADERVAEIWGSLRQPVLIVPSAQDEHVPRDIDVGELMERWKRACGPRIASSRSAMIPDANHRVDNDPTGRAQAWLANRVHDFLREDILRITNK